MPTLLLTGANRGIGKRLAELYAEDGWDVIAAVRSPDTYDGPGDALPLDVTDAESIDAVANTLSGRPIDVLWNNAGVYLDKNVPLSQLNSDAWEETFRVNTIAPIMLARALMNNVLASDERKMAFTSSKMGSIGLVGSGAYAYRSSKTALNMAVALLNQEVGGRGGKTVLLHPGWVRTDMGGPSADIDTDTSAGGMKSVVDGLSDAQSGSFMNYDGKEFPW